MPGDDSTSASLLRLRPACTYPVVEEVSPNANHGRCFFDGVGESLKPRGSGFSVPRPRLLDGMPAEASHGTTDLGGQIPPTALLAAARQPLRPAPGGRYDAASWRFQREERGLVLLPRF